MTILSSKKKIFHINFCFQNSSPYRQKVYQTSSNSSTGRASPSSPQLQQQFSPQNPYSSPQHPCSSPTGSYGSNSNASSDYCESSPRSTEYQPKIWAPTLTNNNEDVSIVVEEKLCPLDNKVFTETFNLDDLSASFRSLYKSVYNQTNASPNNNNTTSSEPTPSGKKFVMFCVGILGKSYFRTILYLSSYKLAI